MVPKPHGSAAKEPDYSDATDAKDLLDKIGEEIYKKAKDDANDFREKLKGTLSQATYPRDKYPEGRTPSDPCELQYEYHTNVTSNVIDPCEHKKGKRLSEVHSSECDNRKIRDSDKKNISVGACAPYRRLHVCDKNLEQLTPEKITNNHNLLLDVCLAAKFEGASIKGYHPQYEVQYPSSGSTMCTMLARSFADIGDIVRGKDLYSGNKKKERLEEKLKQYFKNIYDNLNGAQKHYKDGAPEFYKLREDWWTANRATVWKALTCDVPKGDVHYFRKTCSMGQSHVNDKCTCANGDVPTYLDYVPQFLRWFEEWAEDFCRKRKKKIENAIKNCRGDNGKERYCDLNGFDCTKTAKKENKLFPDSECHKCSVACNPFVPWIDNQQKEFLKQKKKYENEIKKEHDTKITIGDKTINNLYVKEFYQQLQSSYKDVEDFLQKLNDESICKKPPTVGKETADAADFTKDNLEETFSRTKYCRACPLCGVNGPKGNWTDIEDKVCTLVEKKYDSNNTTNIDILTADKSQKNILQKYNKFCKNGANDEKSATPTANGGGQIKNWQCYYDEEKPSGQNNNCILGKWEDFTGNEDVTSYNVFFYNSIIEMLNDSIEWKDKLNSCINNETGKCRKLCKNPCECYKRWIEKKKTELEKIKEHFHKQRDIEDLAFREMTLRGILNVTFLDDIKDAYLYKQQLQKIEERLKDKMEEGFNFERSQTSIDKFLQEEEQFAEKCLEKHNDCPPPPVIPADKGVARAGGPPAVPSRDTKDTEEDTDSEEDEDDTDDGAVENQVEVKEDTEAKTEEEVTKETTTTLDVCPIVKKALEDDLSEACNLKYVKGKNYGWKCVPTEKPGEATSEGSSGENGALLPRAKRAAPSSPSGKDTGSICVPPRRRRLYVGKLQEWVKSGKTEASVSLKTSESSQAGSESQTPLSGTPSQSEKLRTAFIESAAVETFFLWDRYKKIKAKEEEEKKKKQQELFTHMSSVDEKPEEELQESGKIPDDFLRQMFYTLGDYRDICVGVKDNDVINALEKSVDNIRSGEKSNNITMKEISSKIEEILKNGDNNKPSGVQNGGTPPVKPNGTTPQQTWWDKHAPSIWNAMVCALTYKDGGEGKTTITQDGTLKEKLLDTEGKKPKPKTDGTNKIEKDNEVYEKLWDEANNKPKNHDYQYSSVTIGGEGAEGQLQSTDSKDAARGEKTPLDSFIKRPPYFRYLEEWGETFCRQRTRMLKNVKHNCRNNDLPGHEHCSGDGHDCTRDVIKHNDMSADPNCPDCYKQCRKYRKWIDIKFVEYQNQKSIYQAEHGKLKANHNCDNKEFCKKIQQHTTAADYLAALKQCKNGQNSENNGNEKEEKNNEINFEDIPQTFSRSTYCKTCPFNIVNCNGGRAKNGCNEVKGNGNTWDSVFNANGENSTTINVHMIDRRGPYMEKKSNDLFNASRLFKGIRKQNWTCKFNKDEDKDVCKLDKFDQEVDLNQHTTFKVLLIYWLEDFIEGKYKCVKEWVEKKKKEWEEIKKHFNIRKDDEAYNIKYTVKTFLGILIPRMDLTNGKEKIQELNKFLRSYECNCAANSTSEDSKKNDVIDCLLDRLQEKATSCPGKTSDSPEEKCGEDPTPLENDEETMEEENSVTQPNICPTVEEPKETEEGEEKCEPASPAPSEEPAPTEPPEEKAPAPAPNGGEEKAKPAKPKTRTKKRHVAPPDDPWEPLKNAMLSSTIMWSIGIGFAAFTYFYLKKSIIKKKN
ncbi:hypothetical protein PFBG_04120 [Plasmodium falciparum 7G8]|uniref:Erythrocyte membrane protein 1 n=4 Tax=Plasmodium falciparum TaxID=5833 RepID=W7EY13_PLAF8|nr:hypothetical protein PFBG_04120 [Plasmodium falciparum 7G8]